MTQTQDGFDDVLPTFAVLARFPVDADDDAAATSHVMQRLTESELPFHEVEVERTEPDGTRMVVVRFVEVSVDEGTAATGLHETLTAAGLAPDEVWVDRAVA